MVSVAQRRENVGTKVIAGIVGGAVGGMVFGMLMLMIGHAPSDCRAGREQQPGCWLYDSHAHQRVYRCDIWVILWRRQ